MSFNGTVVSTGVAAGVTKAAAAGTTAGVGDGDTAAGGVTAAVTAGADAAPGTVFDTDDRATTACCTACVTALPCNGMEPALDNAGVADPVVLPGPAGALSDFSDGVEALPVVVVVAERLPPLEDTVLDGGACL
jgi:hypothetical protein